MSEMQVLEFSAGIYSAYNMVDICMKWAQFDSLHAIELYGKE